MRKKFKKFIQGYTKEILIIVVFVIAVILIHNLFIDSYGCGMTWINSGNNSDPENICLALGSIGQSIFAGSFLISIILLYKTLKR